jgi:hypothetical protein
MERRGQLAIAAATRTGHVPEPTNFGENADEAGYTGVSAKAPTPGSCGSPAPRDPRLGKTADNNLERLGHDAGLAPGWMAERAGEGAPWEPLWTGRPQPWTLGASGRPAREHPGRAARAAAPARAGRQEPKRAPMRGPLVSAQVTSVHPCRDSMSRSGALLQTTAVEKVLKRTPAPIAHYPKRTKEWEK